MKLYNTLTRRAETFTPADDVVKMYVCGLTPYGLSHIGHALHAVIFDMLRRYLEFNGYQVKHVENFTDIDDKMIAGAAERGVTVQELADSNIEAYFRQMDALNILRAHVYPWATQEIPQMLKIIEELIRREMAYVVDGDVYFSVRQKEDYGKLSNRSLDSMRARARVEVREHKQDDMDFALWKSQKPGEPAWDSPWGPGRPGWHIECSAMSLHHLGETIDIHGGGQDLIFPHHENEIAQSETYNDGTQMSRFWVHNGLLMVDQHKMSQSLGNLVTMQEALERYSSDALRLFFLNSHYRSPLTYSDELVEAQERAAERLRNAATVGAPTGDGDALAADPYREQFVEAMDDDLNTPRAIAALFDLAHEINRAAEDGRDVSDAQDALAQLAGVLGLTLEAPAAAGELMPLHRLLAETHDALQTDEHRELAERIAAGLADAGYAISEPGDNEGGDPSPLLDLLVDARSGLREARLFAQADGIRESLADLGYVLEDKPEGTRWRRSAFQSSDRPQ